MSDDESSSAGGDAITLDPGSDAEEAVLVTAAAIAVVAFLRKLQDQRGGSQKLE